MARPTAAGADREGGFDPVPLLNLAGGMRLSPRRISGGAIRGERLSPRKGVSIEFADYREYAEGDDLRHVDWNVLARLDHAVLRTYRDEQDLPLHLLLDSSASMSFGTPTKLVAARDVAFLLGSAALFGGDSLWPRWVGGAPPSLPMRGGAAVGRWVSWCSDPPEEAKASPSVALRALARSSARRGLVVLVGDGLDPDLPAALSEVQARGHELWMVQVLAPEELDPDLEGDLRLIDSETGAAVEITANREALETYRTRLTKLLNDLEAAATRMGGRYALLNATDSLPDFVRGVLLKQGWVRT